jgi:hypothetical protein
MECLTIKLLQSYGHTVFLWSYNDIDNVPIGTVVKDARQILEEDTIFKYSGQPLNLIPNGGIGSLSHWSDQFQLRLLSIYGGIYIQLDVACLKPLDFQSPYTFVSHQTQTDIAAFLMKCPKESMFALQAYDEVKKAVNSDTLPFLNWDDSMKTIGMALEKYLPENSRYKLPHSTFLDLGCRRDGPFFDNQPLPASVYIIHWSNATVHEKKNNPIKGSFYESLLARAGLV